MSVTDADRELRSRLQHAIGPDATETLLTKFGNVGRDQTTLDARMQVGFSQLRGEIADLRAELKTDMADLRGEFGDLRGEFGDLRGEFGDLRAEVAERLEQQTRHLMFGMIGSMATISGIAFGAARLG